ncbi:MAG TPA: hypothetical protein VEB87_00665 [Nitrososphaerales archaeon]|nr:hypothetical protein [Nitrososphaerales archaeon]
MGPLQVSGTQKVAVVSLLTALAITTDYAMLPLANIKLMDTIVFVSGLVFGLDVGVSVGALTWLVYGSVNPLGSAGGPLLLILIVSETVYAILGSLARKVFSFEENSVSARSLFWGCLGLIGAFIYDLVTIIVPTMLTGASLVVAVASLVPAVPFMLAHEISDFVFFAAVGPILVSTMLKVIKSRGTPLPHSGVQESLLSAAMVTMVSS